MLSIKEIGAWFTLAISIVTFAVWLGKLDGRMTATESHLEKMEQTIVEEKKRALNEIRLVEEEVIKRIKTSHCIHVNLFLPKDLWKKIGLLNTLLIKIVPYHGNQLNAR